MLTLMEKLDLKMAAQRAITQLLKREGLLPEDHYVAIGMFELDSDTKTATIQYDLIERASEEDDEC